MKKSLEDYREGAIGALIDEHEKALEEFLLLVAQLRPNNFTSVVNPNPGKDGSKSIKEMCDHVMDAIYAYSNSIRRNHDLEELEFPDLIDNSTEVPEKLQDALKALFATLELLGPEAVDPWKIKIQSKSWGESNLELLLEHSIVHILRHRRQLEKYILILPTNA